MSNENINKLIDGFYMLQLLLKMGIHGQEGSKENTYYNKIFQEVQKYLTSEGFRILEIEQPQKKKPSERQDPLDVIMNIESLVPEFVYKLSKDDQEYIQVHSTSYRQAQYYSQGFGQFTLDFLD